MSRALKNRQPRMLVVASHRPCAFPAKTDVQQIRMHNMHDVHQVNSRVQRSPRFFFALMGGSCPLPTSQRAKISERSGQPPRRFCAVAKSYSTAISWTRRRIGSVKRIANSFLSRVGVSPSSLNKFPIILASHRAVSLRFLKMVSAILATPPTWADSCFAWE